MLVTLGKSNKEYAPFVSCFVTISPRFVSHASGDLGYPLLQALCSTRGSQGFGLRLMHPDPMGPWDCNQGVGICCICCGSLGVGPLNTSLDIGFHDGPMSKLGQNGQII